MEGSGGAAELESEGRDFVGDAFLFTIHRNHVIALFKGNGAFFGGAQMAHYEADVLFEWTDMVAAAVNHQGGLDDFAEARPDHAGELMEMQGGPQGH